MFPDFPKIKLEVKKNFEEHLRKQSVSDPLVGSITQVLVHEGDKLIYHTVEGDKKETTFNKIQSEFTMKNDEIIDKGAKALVSTINEIAGDFQNQIGNNILAKLEDTTKETGNIIDGKGQEISPDLIIKALEKMPIDFDEEGNPYMPTLFVSPEMGKKIGDKIPEWEKDETHKRRVDELMLKKKEEWNDRESNRKLVD
jgi:hypothetical protein